jgi:serine/threonine protein kinase
MDTVGGQRARLMTRTVDLDGRGTVVGERTPPDVEVPTLVMSLPAVAGVRLLAPLTGAPIARAPAVRESDGLPVRLLLLTVEIDQDLSRRVRVECAELEAILTGIDPAAVLPVLDHGLDQHGRPYLLLPRPGPDLIETLDADGPLPLPLVLAAARSTAAGLAALAERGVLGPPRALCRDPAGTVTLEPPLPPALAEIESSLAPGAGHEPPEVLGGGEWTSRGQVYACASLLWTLLTGAPPFGADGSPLARLVATHPPRLSRPDVPDAVETLLGQALTADPSARPPTPSALARALREAAQSSPGQGGGHPPDAGRPLGSGYLLDIPIGRGSGGHVWAGRRRADARPVAVKVLHGDLVEDEQAVSRFVREFTVLVRLRHPHLVRVHDLVVEGGDLAIVMDLVDGEDLRRIVRRGPLAPAAAASLLAQAADGLAAVHAAGVIHRDVKPQNVLVTERDGRTVALLSDFGIARPVEGAANTQLIGTPAYLAPEVIAGRPPSTASDVYALGVTAYELLAGHQPFRGDNADAVMRAHLDQPPTRLDGLDPRAWDLVAACLDKAPERRPTAAEVAQRWGRIAADPSSVGESPVGALSVGESAAVDHGDGALATAFPARPLRDPPAPPPSRRRRRALALGVAAVAAAGLATGVLLASRSGGGGAPAGPSASAPYPVLASVSLDASSVATLTWGEQAGALPGFEGYVVLDVSGDAARPLTPRLPAERTSYQVEGLRAGRRTCFLVIALGVTARPPEPLPPPACVTPPTNRTATKGPGS